jgi:hypothetical protein
MREQNAFSHYVSFMNIVNDTDIVKIIFPKTKLGHQSNVEQAFHADSYREDGSREEDPVQ